MQTPQKYRSLPLAVAHAESPWWDIQLILVSAGILITLVSTGEKNGILDLLQLFLGLLHTLYVPGYCLTLALFPRRDDLNTITRVAISFGVSAALLPLMALLLDVIPRAGGIWLWPMMRMLLFWMVGTCSIGLWQRWSLSIDNRAYIPAVARIPQWWARLPQFVQLRYAISTLIFVGSIIFFLNAAISVVTTVHLTEFYILGSEGMVEAYPRSAVIGEDVMTTIGISNQEGVERTYQVEVWVTDGLNTERKMLVQRSRSITLSPGERQEWPISWRMPWPGIDQRVEFLLFVEGDFVPYRRLYFSMERVTAARNEPATRYIAGPFLTGGLSVV